jgi:hypothetical protein
MILINIILVFSNLYLLNRHIIVFYQRHNDV